LYPSAKSESGSEGPIQIDLEKYQSRKHYMIITSLVSEMSGRLYFAIQIQSGIFKLQSKSSQSSKFYKIRSPSPNIIQKIDKIYTAFQQQKLCKFFHYFSINPGLILNSWRKSQPGSNPNPTKFIIA